jgi:DNA adenine methylase
LYRENKQGQFNVPFGRYKNPTICDEDNLRAVSVALQGVRLERRHYLSVMRRAKPGDFVYFDPPYWPRSRTASFTAYDRNGFGEADQRTLHDAFVELAGRGVYVMLSNSNTPLVHELYADFNINRVFANRPINSKGNKRGKISELIIRNY